MRSILAVLLVLAAAASAAAVEIPFKNGEVVEAASYSLTGSYLIVTRPDGSRVAYDVADVDLEALRAGEATAPAAEAPPPEPRPGSILDAVAPADRPQASVAITDQDVARAAPEPDEVQASSSTEEAGGGPPPGYTEGQGVVIEGIRIEPVDEGMWDIRGRVANRTPTSVDDVRIQLELFAGSDEPLGSPTIELASTLAVGDGVTFSHHVEASKRPTVRARVFWLQPATDEAPARAPGGARGAAPPDTGSEEGEPPARPTPTGAAY
jgi:hypothetical protein